MFVAAHNGHTDIVRVLAERHADVNKAMNDGATPMYMAAHKGHTDTVRVLGECVDAEESATIL